MGWLCEGRLHCSAPLFLLLRLAILLRARHPCLQGPSVELILRRFCHLCPVFPQETAGHVLNDKIIYSVHITYKVTIHVVLNLPLTPKQRLCFSAWASYYSRLFALISTGGWEQRRWTPCRLQRMKYVSPNFQTNEHFPEMRCKPVPMYVAPGLKSLPS